MDRVEFQFELHPLEEVAPFGSVETGLSLSWFGLTDGWYNMIVGEHRLFSASDVRGVDYYVVRLWEDLIDLAPRALKSIPQGLAVRLANIDAWKAWSDKVWELDEHDELVSVALRWWWQRQMDLSYLVGAPCFHFWRERNVLRIHWHSSPRAPDEPVWSSPRGDATVNPDAFREELIKFDRDLISAMESRVAAVERSWSRPEIKIDIEGLRREQVSRSTRLESALKGPSDREHDWDDVVAAVIELERQIGTSLVGGERGLSGTVGEEHE